MHSMKRAKRIVRDLLGSPQHSLHFIWWLNFWDHSLQYSLYSNVFSSSTILLTMPCSRWGQSVSNDRCFSSWDRAYVSSWLHTSVTAAWRPLLAYRRHNQLELAVNTSCLSVLTLLGWISFICWSLNDNSVPNKCLLVATCSDVT